MANLKEIRVRIASVTSTRQITNAMKMVSAAKLKKAQDAIIQLRPYAQKLNDILVNINSSLDSSDENIYGTEKPLRNVLFILVTSNRGQCGAFNSNVIKEALTSAVYNYENLYKQGNVKFLCIGKDYLKGKKIQILATYNQLVDKPSYEKTLPVAEEIMNMYTSGKFEKIVIVYNRFKNAAVQILTEEQFLPVQKVEAKNDLKKTNTDYIFEPSKEEILSEIIPKSLKIQFHKALLDSLAAEHGARMTAMHKATDNATEMIKELTLNYNKARQASITGEILEIVGGAEALKG